MDPVDSARVFLQVIRAGGFTGAAKSLGRSASTLSRVIAALETHLGAQLLARTTRSLHLTEAGAVYQAHAERLVSASDAAEDAMADLRGGAPRGHLRVSMPVSVGERLLAPHLPAFRDRYPELRLSIDLSDRNVSLTQGGFDLAIRVGRAQDTSLRALLLGKIPILLVGAPAYLQRRGTPKKPGDVSKHDHIGIAGAQEWSFRRGRRRVTIPIDPIVSTTSPTLGVQLATAAQGLARTAEWLVRDELARGSLIPLLSNWSAGAVPIYVMYAQAGSTAPPQKSRVFVDPVKSIMALEVSRQGNSISSL